MITRISCLALVISACGSNNTEVPPLPKETNVELVQRGAAPYRELRYHVAKGTKTTIEVGVSSVLAGRPSPTVTTTLAFTGEDVRPDGGMVLRSVLEKTVGTSPDGQPLPAELVNFFEGTQITATLSPVGTVSDPKVVPGPHPMPTDELEAEMTALPKMFEQATFALPNAPVGAGAIWKTRKVIEENGVRVTAVTTFTVTAIDGDTVTYTRTSQLSGPDQTIAKDGHAVALSNIAGSGDGKGSVNLATFALTAESSQQYAATIRDKADSTGATDQLAVTMKLTMQPK
ncbi:MAG TPA: DUF6263 family protein [Kofleriaceae bacterium]|nr:DUF6263 family protein [Kofleriaceae bacterium]